MTRRASEVSSFEGIPLLARLPLDLLGKKPENDLILPAGLETYLHQLKTLGLFTDPSTLIIFKIHISRLTFDAGSSYNLEFGNEYMMDVTWGEENDSTLVKFFLYKNPTEALPNKVVIYSGLRKAPVTYSLEEFTESMEQAFSAQDTSLISTETWAVLRGLDVATSHTINWDIEKIKFVENLLSEGHSVSKISRFLQCGMPLEQVADYIQVPEDWVNKIYPYYASPTLREINEAKKHNQTK